MAFNPMNLMKMKGRYKTFNAEHPKFVPFFKSLQKDVQPGAVLEVNFTTVGGEKKTANIRLTADDVETVHMLFK